MLKGISTAVVFSFVSAIENAYVAPAPSFGEYAYPQHAGYYRNTFPQATQVLDPKYYQKVLNGFKECVDTKCTTLPTTYTVADSLETVATYTACVTSCAASEMMSVTVDFKSLIGKLIDIGSSQLAKSHRYLAGEDSEFDVLGSNIHIQESCCLPNDYFVPWEELVFLARVKFPNDETYESERFISVKSYLEYCTQEDQSEDNVLFLNKLEIECHSNWVKYFHEMSKNVGHLILSPKCKSLAPSGACSKDLDNNPQSDAFGEAMCIAYDYIKDGKREEITQPIMKYPSREYEYKDSCKSDQDEEETVIHYRRVPREHVPYYTMISGLPSGREDIELEEFEIGKKFPKQCIYDQGLVKHVASNETVIRYGMVSDEDIPTWREKKSMYKCPRNGRFEYCNMKQYVHWLQEQLFDVSGCPMTTSNRRHHHHHHHHHHHSESESEEEEPSDSPYAYYTLACLYRVISLKCDCMEAVLTCYEHEYQFSTTIGKTLGKAASVLCGFILCQKPKVYSLLGGERAINRANIMKQVLMQVGAISHESSFPPVTFAFLAFGCGMLAFILTKAAINGKGADKISVEEGYRNLI